MVGSKRTRSKTAAMAQSMTAQSYSSHDLVIDMAAPLPLAAMNQQQTLIAVPQQPPPCDWNHRATCQTRSWDHRTGLYCRRTISRRHGWI
ncbi:unnamed protein product [Prunus armeniaca]